MACKRHGFAKCLPTIPTDDGKQATFCKGCSQLYIDDILVGSWVDPGEDLLKAHDREVRKDLELLKGYECVVGKWKLFVKEVEFCGHILGGGFASPPPASSEP